MTKRSEFLQASGYLFSLAPAVLLGIASFTSLPYLPFVGLIVVAPFLRSVFGDFDESPPPEWSEGVATFLDFLPIAVGVAYLIACGCCIVHVARLIQVSRVGTMLGLWTSSLFASCVAHELLHRKTLVSRVLGRVVAGAIGYPLLEHEHRAHHASNGTSKLPEWPLQAESVWHFSGRRFRHTLATAWRGDRVAAMRNGHPLAGGLPLAIGTFIVCGFLFFLFGGTTALCIYLIQALATAWGMHAMTYVQHWGLGRYENDSERYSDLAWEDTCRLQCWLTFGIPYHQGHHLKNHRAYYRLAPTEGSPRQPAGYVVLLVACCFPPLWRALMKPALDAWRSSEPPLSAGRGLICIRRG